MRALKLTVRSLPFVVLAHEAGAAGLPQLDNRWYPNQILWLVLSFSLLYIVVSAVIAPAIKAILTTRESAIDDAIREAERAKHMAESTKSGAESANLESRNKAQAFLLKAQSEVSANAHEAFAKLDHDLDRKLAQADVRIEESKAKAMKAVQAATADLAGAMAAKLLGRDVADADVERAISDATKKEAA